MKQMFVASKLYGPKPTGFVSSKDAILTHAHNISVLSFRV